MESVSCMAIYAVAYCGILFDSLEHDWIEA
jgi:hypothetical protein